MLAVVAVVVVVVAVVVLVAVVTIVVVAVAVAVVVVVVVAVVVVVVGGGVVLSQVSVQQAFSAFAFFALNSDLAAAPSLSLLFPLPATFLPGWCLSQPLSQSQVSFPCPLSHLCSIQVLSSTEPLFASRFLEFALLTYMASHFAIAILRPPILLMHN